MYEITIGLLTGVATLTIGGAVMLIRKARKEGQEARRRVLEGLTDENDGTESRMRFVYAIHRLGELVSKGRISQNLVQGLIQAGYHRQSAPAIYLGSKLILFGVGVIGIAVPIFSTGLPIHVKIAAGMGGGCALFMLPNLAVGFRRRKRQREVQRFLADAIDLLEICVSSGMGLEQAWNAVADEIRRVSTVLSDEMELTNLEIRLGVERSISMRHMAERTGADEISSLVALMIQSDRFGASIVDALRIFAVSMRETSSNKAEEAAEKMAVKMLAPMVLCIFPTLLIVMVGPAVLRIVDVMM